MTHNLNREFPNGATSPNNGEVILDIDEGVLIARIEYSTVSPDIEYAFYLLRDGKRIETRWYQSKPYIRFNSKSDDRRYRVIGFVRINGETEMIASKTFRRAVRDQLPSIAVRKCNLDELNSFLPSNGRARFDLIVPGLPFEYQCLLYRKSGDCLYVIFGGTVPDREKAILPRFSRFTWAPDFPGPVLCIADPSLMLDARIRLGWYFGNAEADATDGLVLVVNAFASALGYESHQIVAYGSNGGGFAAMQVASRIGGGATAVAINTQTNIMDYGNKDAVNEFLTVCVGTSKTDAEARFDTRISLTAAWHTQTSTQARFLILQNIQDHHHFERHLLPFAENPDIPVPGNSKDGRMKIVLYDDPNGHGAEPRSMVPQILKNLSDLSLPFQNPRHILTS